MNENRLQLMFSFVTYNNSYKNEHKGQQMKYNNMTCET